MVFKINEDIITYANTFLDEVNKIKNYTMVQNNLYEAFGDYTGEAKKEIQDMQGQLSKQLNQLCNYYIYLSNGLIDVVNTMFEQDRLAAKDYYQFLITSLERTGTVPPGQLTVEMVEKAYQEAQEEGGDE